MKARATKKTARRLRPQVREQQIVDEAIRFFSEHGWSASTIELARRLGVTQPLLFRYFPTKDALIQRIYEEIETQIFNPDWVRWIEDETRPLQDRLSAFYRDYFARVMTKDRFRLFLHEGLSGDHGHAKRYYGLTRRTIFAAVVRALRRVHGQIDPQAPVSPDELEVVLSLHGMIHHLAVRRWVYGPSIRADRDAVIDMKVRLFLAGAPTALQGASTNFAVAKLTRDMQVSQA